MHKKLKNVMGDETWPTGSGPLHRMTAMYENCTGHEPDDVVPFRFSLQTLDDVGATRNTSETKLYTNRELYEIADPGWPTLPCVLLVALPLSAFGAVSRDDPQVRVRALPMAALPQRGVRF